MKQAFLLLWVMFLYSCADNAQEHFKMVASTTTYFAKKSFDYDTKNRLSISYYSNPSGEYLFFLDRKSSKLELYMMHENKLKLLSVKNLNKIFASINSSPEAITVISLDSILVSSKYNNKVCLVDTSFKTDNLFDISYKNYTVHNFSQPLYYRKGLLYMLKTPPINIFENARNLAMYYKDSPGIIFNMKTQSVHTSDVSLYPSKIDENNSYQTFNPYTCVDAEGNYIFSYGPFNELYVYDVRGKLLSAHTAKSQFYKNPTDFSSKYLGDDKYTYKYVMTNGLYKDLIFDKYRNLFYRVYIHPMSIASEEILPSPAEKQWSILVLNQKFQVAGEHKMPVEYDPNTLLVTKNGILVSENRFMSEAYTKGNIKYRLFHLNSHK